MAEPEEVSFRLLVGTGDSHEALLRFRGGIEGDRVRGMVRLFEE